MSTTTRPVLTFTEQSLCLDMWVVAYITALIKNSEKTVRGKPGEHQAQVKNTRIIEMSTSSFFHTSLEPFAIRSLNGLPSVAHQWYEGGTRVARTRVVRARCSPATILSLDGLPSTEQFIRTGGFSYTRWRWYGTVVRWVVRWVVR